MKQQRHFTPCRVCGKEHKNPASSSICGDCGYKKALENQARKEEIKRREEEELLENSTEARLDRLEDRLETLIEQLNEKFLLHG